ncbi:unnamed protein product [Lymnaea stagnalis]|uniref:Fucosyltransferase n=1 Tax=Lymnaea stagnalis TaxID=6523 RepID=A0AAV2HQ21_LYMST
MNPRIPSLCCRRCPGIVGRRRLVWVLACCLPPVAVYYLTQDLGMAPVSGNRTVKDRLFGPPLWYSQPQPGPDHTSRDRLLEPLHPTVIVSRSPTAPTSPSSFSITPAPFKTYSKNSSSTGVTRETFSDRFTSPFMIPDDTEDGSPTAEFKGITSRREKLVFRDTNARPVVARTMAYLFPCENRTKNCFHTGALDLKKCRFNNCEVTLEWRDANVVVFYPFKMTRAHILPNFTRRSRQRWVMFTPEAPCRARNFRILTTPQFIGQFNWSLTYLLDSDIPRPYGKLRRVTPAPDKNYDAVYSSKRVQAAWFVSHCNTSSLRLQYVKRLQKIVPVHVFGKCGNYSCAEGSNKRREDHSRCFPLLSRKYFYYLAFENSLCVDYVTEKLFKLFTNADVIPVVRGGADYKRYFPPDTFIDASDFDSPEALGEYLKDLSQDKDRYLKMLRTKSQYESAYVESWPCKLCEKMNKDTGVQWYPGTNMWTWFVQDQCNNPTRV